MARKSASLSAAAPVASAGASSSSAPWAMGGALAAAFAATLLGLYQWMELFVAGAGGDLSCSLSASIDCAPVWSSGFAKSIAAVTGMPVAAWGVVWGLAAFAAPLAYAMRALKQETARAELAAHTSRVIAAAGVGSSVVLAVVSIGVVGVACPTCMLTYVLTAAYAVAAVKLPGPLVPPKPALFRAFGWSLAAVVTCYALLLAPARRTPASPDQMLKNAIQKAPIAAPAARPDAGAAAPRPSIEANPVSDFLAKLEPMGRQMVADALLVHRSSPVHTQLGTARIKHGPAGAPIQIVEWTDIKCGHCAEFVATMKQVERDLPAGSFSLVPRQFPLDNECNPALQHSDGSGVRCAAARALICLEPTGKFFEAQERMFGEQQALTKDRVLAIAAPLIGGPAALERCMKSPETEAKLREDVQLALGLGIHGTPLVIVNGRTSPSLPPFLYALMLAGGRGDHPGFGALPPPRPPTDDHAGHGH